MLKPWPKNAAQKFKEEFEKAKSNDWFTLLKIEKYRVKRREKTIEKQNAVKSSLSKIVLGVEIKLCRKAWLDVTNGGVQGDDAPWSPDDEHWLGRSGGEINYLMVSPLS